MVNQFVASVQKNYNLVKCCREKLKNKSFVDIIQSEVSSRLSELVKKLGVIQKGNFPLTSGGYSDWKFIVEVGLESKEFTNILGEKGAALLYSIENENGLRSLATVDTGGTLFLNACLHYLGQRDYVVVKKNNEFRGEIQKKPYTIFEDVITQGYSVKRVADVISYHGGHVGEAIAILDREEGGREFLEKYGINVYSILKKGGVL